MPLTYRSENRTPFCTNSEAIRCILDVASREDFAIVGEDSRADGEATIRTIGVACDFARHISELLNNTIFKRQMGTYL